MKLIVLTLAFPLVAMAIMTITTNEHVSTTLTPDVLQGSLTFDEENNNTDIIKKHLNAIIVQVKQFDPKTQYCQGGSYQITPQYTYIDQKSTFMGYNGSLYFGCEFSNIEQYNTLVKKIDAVITKEVHKKEGNLSWEISEEQHIITQKALRATLLQTADTQAKSFSQKTTLSCEVSSVSFNNEASSRPLAIRNTPRQVSYYKPLIPTQSPIQHDQKTSLDATVTYSCSK